MHLFSWKRTPYWLTFSLATFKCKTIFSYTLEVFKGTSTPLCTMVLYMSFDRFLLAVESSWQKYHMSVFFPKVEWWVAELLFLSLDSWGLKMNALNLLRFTSHQKNWEKCKLFNVTNWMIKFTKASNFAWQIVFFV